MKPNLQILTRSTADCQTQPWKQAVASAFTEVAPLLASLGLRDSDIPDLDPTPDRFRMLVPKGFAALMIPGDPADPLLRQVLPLMAERESVEGFVTDPVGDSMADRGAGLLQKYAGRALLMVTGGCAIHCRYCFRRHFPYRDLGGTSDRWDSAVTRIAADPSLTEIILSGGDPLMLDDAVLGDLIAQLCALGQVRRLRIHTRLPVIIPERVTDALCEKLTGGRIAPVVVLHVNHPRELGHRAEQALLRLQRAGIRLLNQSVLLRGVNDAPDTLSALSERLFDCGVLPYYLHALDPVAGAAHFRTDTKQATMLIETLRGQLPGYLLPSLVREVAGGRSKVPIG